jgi:membrane fusion protein (multidrug efflux system)
MDVVITQPYIGRIHSQRHINIRTLKNGYLKEIKVREGQAVKKGDLMFKIVRTRDMAKLDAEAAKDRLAELESEFTRQLVETQAEPDSKVRPSDAKRDRADAKLNQAQSELNFTDVNAPFDGIVGRLHQQLGSLVKEGDILTTLSDNSVMWVYFNVPERAYLEYLASEKKDRGNQKIELELANRSKFPQRCMNITVEAQFNKETGSIPFRADFPNPDGLLRHGQTGTILIRRTLHDVTVIPQRATFEIMDKRYVYVVDNDDVVHRREISIKHETDDIFVVHKGVGVDDRIVVEGIRQARDGQKVECEFRPPEEVMRKLGNHAD